MATAQQIAANNLRKRQQAQQQAFATTAQPQLRGGGNTSLISGGLNSINTGLGGAQRRRDDQRNIDAANLLRESQQQYLREQDALAREDRLAAQAFDQQLATDKFGFEKQSAADRLKQEASQWQQEQDLARDKFDFEKSRPRGGSSNPYQLIETKQGIFKLNRETGDLSPYGGVQDTLPLTESQQEAVDTAVASYEQAQGGLDVIDQLSLQDYYNVGGYYDSRKSDLLKDTDEVASRNLFDQLGGQGFLKNIEAFQGKGALSDAEGRAIRTAFNGIFDENGLKKGIGEKELYNQIGIIQRGLRMAQERSRFIEKNRGKRPSIAESDAIRQRVLDTSTRPTWEQYTSGMTTTQPAGSNTVNWNDL